MPPKMCSGKIFGTVVTKKVVEETVQVLVSPNETISSSTVEVVASSTKENEKVEVISSPPSENPVVRNVVVEDSGKVQTKQHNEQDSPRRVDRAEVPKDQEVPEIVDHEDEDEDETQPAEDQEEQQNEDDRARARAGPTTRTPPPREGAKKRKATPENTDQEEKKGRRKRKRAKAGVGRAGIITGVVYKRYVYRVLKQVHPEMGMSSKAMTIVNNLMNDMCERIAEEASRLTRYGGKKTLSSWDVQDAVKLVLPGELGKHAIAEGSKAVSNYVSSVLGRSKKSKPKSSS